MEFPLWYAGDMDKDRARFTCVVNEMTGVRRPAGVSCLTIVAATPAAPVLHNVAA